MQISRDRRALSPIFASLLILAIVTVLFIPIFIWSTGFTAKTQQFWEISGTIATERIVIEEVNLRGGAISCTIYVRNIGKTAIIIENVFISEPNGAVHTYRKPQFTTDFNSVVQGDLITVNILDLLPFTPPGDTYIVKGATYTIKVYTTRGVGDTYQVVA